VFDHDRPHHIAVAPDDGVGPAQLMRLVWIQRGVDAAEDDRRSPGPRGGADLVPAQRIARVDSNPHDVTRLDRVEVEGLERLIHDVGPSVGRRGGGAQDEQPPRRDDAHAEGQMTRIHQVDGHRTPHHPTEGDMTVSEWEETGVDIVALLRGSSWAAADSEAEATSRRAWHQSGGQM
jgi:hypothetical protein